MAVQSHIGSPPPVPPRRGPPRPFPGPGLFAAAAWVIGVATLVFFLPVWIWFWWRIEPGSDEIAVLVRKTGADLPSGEILALKPGQKGIQLPVLPPGRYFRNPYTWGWELHPVTDVPAGRLAVLTRLYGEDLPPGRIIATDTSKGILQDVLGPGKHFVNPYAFAVSQEEAITIRAGSVGVVVALTGGDVLTGELPAESRNVFLVPEGLKGVQTRVLDAGTYLVNPYIVDVVEVTLQSQQFSMSGEDAITFLTADGFTITVEGTLEYALMREKVALLTHQIGDMEDILRKIVLPRARGFSRIEGSKNPAKNYITGDTRQLFQDNLEKHLRKLCEPWGIEIRSVLIRNITPPDEIASVIRDREVAVQTAKTYEQQLEQAKSKAELTRQETLALQNKAKVEADTARIRAVIQAAQDLSVKVTAANRELAVARLENDASKAQAAAILARAGGEQEVIRQRNEAEAEVFASQVLAYGSGLDYARRAFYEKVGPRIGSVLSTDGPDGLGALFLPYLPDKPGAPPPAAAPEAGKGVTP